VLARQDVADRVLGLPVAAALGLRFTELADGRATSRLPWRPELSHAPGVFQANPSPRWPTSPA
jgi:acyl-coenzyme A thioesterase PaaI-like protein